MTNREWLNSLSDEKLASKIYGVMSALGWIPNDLVFYDESLVTWLQAEREEKEG